MNENIAKALVNAQKEFGPALKSATNPHFKSKYADLSACVEAVIDSLNANGVMLLQKNHPSEHGVSVETIFLHESGEEYSAGILNVPATKLDAQGYGSALTYARRYSLMAACGIAPEDDDGNAASKGSNVTQITQQTKTKLPTLSDEEAEKVHAKWYRFRETLLDEDGDIDQQKVADEWGKLTSNVRTAIKKIDDRIAAQKKLDEEANQHIKDIAQG
jgi:hypothetical protein